MANTVISSLADASMVDLPLWLQAAGADPSPTYTALNDRQLIDALYQDQGVIGVIAFKVIQRGAGANFSVDVILGRAIVLGDDVTNQGKFLVQSLATVNVATPAAPGSGTRTHRVIIRIRDKQASGSNYDWTLELLEDTGTGLPAEPNSAITLATVSIAAAQASVLNANIIDLRSMAHLYNVDTAVLLKRLAAQSIPNSTFTAITWDTEILDTDFTVTVSTSTILITHPGYYLVTYEVTWAGTTGTHAIRVQQNAVDIPGAYCELTGGITAQGCTGFFVAAAGDLISANTFQSSGGALNVTNAAIGIVRVSGTRS